MNDDAIALHRPGDGRLFKGASLFACVVLGAVMLAAAYHKILNPLDFAKSVSNYQAAPDGLINLVAVFLPWLELVIGVSLIAIPRYRLSAAWLSLLLLIFFTVLIWVTLQRGISISCGCFSSDPEASKVGWKKVAENTGFIALNIAAIAALVRQRARG